MNIYLTFLGLAASALAMHMGVPHPHANHDDMALMDHDHMAQMEHNQMALMEHDHHNEKFHGALNDRQIVTTISVPFPPAQPSTISTWPPQPATKSPTASIPVPLGTGTPGAGAGGSGNGGKGANCGKGYTYCGFMLVNGGHHFSAATINQTYCNDLPSNCANGVPKTSPDQAVFLCMNANPAQIRLDCACSGKCQNEAKTNFIAHCDKSCSNGCS